MKEVIFCNIVDCEGHPASVLIDVSKFDMSNQEHVDFKEVLDTAEAHPLYPDEPRSNEFRWDVHIPLECIVDTPCKVHIVEQIDLYQV